MKKMPLTTLQKLLLSIQVALLILYFTVGLELSFLELFIPTFMYLASLIEIIALAIAFIYHPNSVEELLNKVRHSPERGGD